MKKSKYVLLCITIMVLVFSGCAKKEQDDSKLLLVEETQRQEIETESTIETTSAETEPVTTETTVPPTTVPKPTSAPIVITKHPSGEIVYPTSRTWFIAHADNAKSISWIFTDPATGQTYTHDSVLTKHKNLETEILPEDTIALRNIPLSLDGWTIQAQFDNDDGFVLTDPATISVIGYEQSYQRAIDFFYKIIHYTNPDLIYEDSEIMDSEWAYPIPELPIGKGSGSLGYFLRDFNEDDIPEFCIGFFDNDNFFRGYIKSMFTLKNGKIELVMNGWSRNRFYLHETGCIYHEGSSGAAYSSYALFEVKDGALIPKNGVWSDGLDADGTARFFSYIQGKQFLEDGERIGQEAFDAYQEKYRRGVIALPTLTPIL